MQDPHEVKYHQQNNQYNQGWDQEWSHDSYSASDSINQELLSLGSDGHQELALPSFAEENKYDFPLHDSLQDYQVLDLKPNNSLYFYIV